MVERERDIERDRRSGLDSSCVTVDETVTSYSSRYAPEEDYYSDWMLIQTCT